MRFAVFSSALLRPQLSVAMRASTAFHVFALLALMPCLCAPHSRQRVPGVLILCCPCGFLQPDGQVDHSRLVIAVQAAAPMQVLLLLPPPSPIQHQLHYQFIFHRAFDVSADLIQSLNVLIQVPPPPHPVPPHLCPAILLCVMFSFHHRVPPIHPPTPLKPPPSVAALES
jgi:hypothetical protein